MLQRHLKNNQKHSSPHLVQRYARIFVPGFIYFSKQSSNKTVRFSQQIMSQYTYLSKSSGQMETRKRRGGGIFRDGLLGHLTNFWYLKLNAQVQTLTTIYIHIVITGNDLEDNRPTRSHREPYPSSNAIIDVDLLRTMLFIALGLLAGLMAVLIKLWHRRRRKPPDSCKF